MRALPESVDSIHARTWLRALGPGALLGVGALLSNITTSSQLSRQADGILTARHAVSVLVNAGSLWAGVCVLAGWVIAGSCHVGRRHAAVAGVFAAWTALGVHYGLGVVTTLMPPSSFAENAPWFGAGAVLGPVLGLLGRLARRTDALGLLARLVVPLGAVAEPLMLGWLALPDFRGWPNVISTRVAGVGLIAGGVMAAVIVIRVWRSSAVRSCHTVVNIS